MKHAFDRLFHNLFGILVLVAILIGAVVAFMFIIGFLIGGSSANVLALDGKKFLDYAIKLATVGVLFGLFKFYITGRHSLTLNQQNLETESENGISA